MRRPPLASPSRCAPTTARASCASSSTASPRRRSPPIEIIACDDAFDRRHRRSSSSRVRRTSSVPITIRRNERAPRCRSKLRSGDRASAPATSSRFADQDDVWQPHKLERLAAALGSSPRPRTPSATRASSTHPAKTSAASPSSPAASRSRRSATPSLAATNSDLMLKRDFIYGTTLDVPRLRPRSAAARSRDLVATTPGS